MKNKKKYKFVVVSFDELITIKTTNIVKIEDEVELDELKKFFKFADIEPMFYISDLFMDAKSFAQALINPHIREIKYRRADLCNATLKTIQTVSEFIKNKLN